MSRISGPFLAAALAGLAVLGADAANASGLQVAPVGVSLTPEAPAGSLTLSNVGESKLHAQVRVYAWRQDRDGDTLEPSEDLMVSPPMIALEPGAQQLVRVIRNGPAPAPGTGEQSFRIVIDELPIGERSGRGLDFVLRYSLPVFVENDSRGDRPALAWDLFEKDGAVALQVTNEGGKHAQIADVAVRAADGSRIVLAEGLLGYALPGASRTWGTAAPWSESVRTGTLEVRIDGQVAYESLPVAPPPR